ncbi:unnamed protein product [Paramecium sonneborni]|uniref:Secreted protein n=1 Tax=Paramecium sonneborni TaxID=65129 RepID=A0A8S1RQP1_9CILI|nr:unnamed protein product [Paramecium sonneborni]
MALNHIAVHLLAIKCSAMAQAQTISISQRKIKQCVNNTQSGLTDKPCNDFSQGCVSNWIGGVHQKKLLVIYQMVNLKLALSSQEMVRNELE